jgi:2-polyprenyl-6-hydroxyphenyl methylase/3-demethylubiquinone-9 3-methyltransferase
VRAYYEAFWADQPTDPEPWAWTKRRALLLAEAKAGDNVLDLGCGAGRFARALQDHGAHPIGVEIADAALQRSRANAPGADLRLMDPDGALPLEDGSIDLVWCSEVLEHVADTAHTLSEIRRVLHTGGRLLLTTPYHGRVRNTAIALARFERHFDPLGQHLRFYTRRSLRATLEEFAFDDIRIDTFGGPPLLRQALVGLATRASLIR